MTSTASRAYIGLSLATLNGPTAEAPSSDPFNDLDRFRGHLVHINEEDANDFHWGHSYAAEPRRTGRLFPALSDSSGLLFPHMASSDIHSDRRERPDWLRETSGCVSALDVHWVSRYPRDGRRTSTDALATAADDAAGALAAASSARVIAGCEDGSVWLFGAGAGPAPATAASTTAPITTPSLPSDSRPYSDALRSPSAVSHFSAETTAASAAPLSPPPDLYRLRHKASLSSLSLGLRSPTNGSAVLVADLSRKASATVSISAGPDPPAPEDYFTVPRARPVRPGRGPWPDATRVSSDSGTSTAASGPAPTPALLPSPPPPPSLTPLVKIRPGAHGPVVQIRVVEGARCARDEAAVAVVLSESGHVAIVSVVDGRCFAACDLGARARDTMDHGRPAHSFTGMDVISLGGLVYVLCHGPAETGIVALELDSLSVVSSASHAVAQFRPALAFLQGMYFLIYGSDPEVEAEQGRDVIPASETAHAERTDNTVSPDPSVEASVLPPSTGPIFYAMPIIHNNENETIQLEEPHSLGTLEGLNGPVLGVRNCAADMIAFDTHNVVLFAIKEQKLVNMAHLKLGAEHITDVVVHGYNSVLVATAVSVAAYRLGVNTADEHTFVFTRISLQPLHGIEKIVPIPTRPHSTANELAYVIARKTHHHRLLAKWPAEEKSETQELYRSPLLHVSPRSVSKATYVYKFSENSAIVGFSTGAVCEVSYAELYPNKSYDYPSICNLAASITVLKLFEFEEGKKVLVAGASDGTAAASEYNIAEKKWSTLGRWNLVAAPVSNVVKIELTEKSHTIAVISANSPVAIVSIDPPKLLFVLPGTKSPVESISTFENDIMVIYTHGLARICDINDLGLRRSMDYKTARNVLENQAWITWYSSANRNSLDPFSALLRVDLRKHVDYIVNEMPWKETQTQAKEETAKENEDTDEVCGLHSDDTTLSLGLTRLLLSNLVSYGLDKECDSQMKRLGIPRVDIDKLFRSEIEDNRCITLPLSGSSLIAPWMFSPAVTAQRLFHIVCLLRVFLNFPDTERDASGVITFYVTMLPERIGPGFAFPAYELFVRYWFDKSVEIQQSARTLFGASMAMCSNQDIIDIVDRWQALLPSRGSSTGYTFGSEEEALLVVGLISVEKFSLLPATVLDELSKSILTYISDDNNPYHQLIAAELCCKGFAIWQNYVEAMELVRHLFALATRRNLNTPADVCNVARHATLHVSSVNTPLFMTTLMFDLLNGKTPEERNGTMKLIGFMIRKRPISLYQSLPRLAEAIVKSLDPSHSTFREHVLQTVTVIMNEMVKTYPSIDFHGKSQRLAVGTHEGAIIVYDVKAGTRMYVLEGHKRPVSALSFSKDGKRLVSVCLDEDKFVVWKVGATLFTLLHPGQPPDQGHNDGAQTPYKTIDFSLGDESRMTVAAILEWVNIEWPADRTVRIHIRESALTFSI